MKQRPILFSAPMVRAILNGSKTQTRRVIKPQPTYGWMNNGTFVDICDIFSEGGKRFGSAHEKWQNYYQIWTHDGVLHHRKRWWIKHPDKFDEIHCPFGEPKDQLWVRESFQPIWAESLDEFPDILNYKTGEGYDCSYPATDGVKEYYDQGETLTKKITPSIFMPRWASRIQLEIIDIRVERLNDISEFDAVWEGYKGFGINGKNISAKTWYKELWESINGTGSWAVNPWVWVVEFKRIQS